MGESEGRFVNSKTSAFWDVLNSEIYVDKTGLLEYTNRVIDTTSKFIHLAYLTGILPIKK